METETHALEGRTTTPARAPQSRLVNAAPSPSITRSG